VTIPDLSAATFLLLLQCIYGARTALTAETAGPLLAAAKRFGVERAACECAAFWRSAMTRETALDMWVRGSAELADPNFGMEFIRSHAAELAQSPAFVDIPPAALKRLLSDEALVITEPELFKAVLRWGRHQVKKRKDAAAAAGGADAKSPAAGAAGGAGAVGPAEVAAVLSEFIHLLRFTLFDVTELASLVTPSGAVDQKDIVSAFQFVTTGSSQHPIPFVTRPRYGSLLKPGLSKLMDNRHVLPLVKYVRTRDSTHSVPVPRAVCGVRCAVCGVRCAASFLMCRYSVSVLFCLLRGCVCVWCAVRLAVVCSLCLCCIAAHATA
jgi:hypothetical protein